MQPAALCLPTRLRKHVLRAANEIGSEMHPTHILLHKFTFVIIHYEWTKDVENSDIIRH